MFCTQCGKQIPDGMKFCPMCGAKIETFDSPAEGSQQGYAPKVQAPGPQGYGQSQGYNQQPYGRQGYNQPQGNIQQGAYQSNQPQGYTGYQPLSQLPEEEPPKKKGMPIIVKILIGLLIAALLFGGAFGVTTWLLNKQRNEAADESSEDSGKKVQRNSQKDGEEGSDGKEDSSKDESGEESKDESGEESKDSGESSENTEASQESSGDSSQESSGESSQETSSESSSEPEPQGPIEGTLQFAVNPMGGIAEIQELTIDSNMGPEWDYFSAVFPRTGYPQQWTGQDIYFTTSYPAGAFAFSIVTETDRRWGVMDYDGNVLFEPILQNYITSLLFKEDHLGFYYTIPEGSYWVSLTTDYTGLEIEEVPPFGFVYFPYYYVYEGKLYFYDGEALTEETTVPDILKGTLVPVFSSKLATVNRGTDIPTGYVYVDASGSFVEQEGYYAGGFFVNGYYAGRQSQTSGLLAVIDPKNGKMVTDFIYDEILYFEEGYCPVKRGGKWGLINEMGQEVISCSFDFMSSVYNGKVAVIYSGALAVIDLNKSLPENTFIPASAVSTAFNEISYVPFAYPDPTQTEMVYIAINNLYIRTGPGTDYSHLSYFIPPGVYKIVEISSGTGSTLGWGKLDSGEGWVALDFCNPL